MHRLALVPRGVHFIHSQIVLKLCSIHCSHLFRSSNGINNLDINFQLNAINCKCHSVNIRKYESHSTPYARVCSVIMIIFEFRTFIDEPLCQCVYQTDASIVSTQIKLKIVHTCANHPPAQRPSDTNLLIIIICVFLNFIFNFISFRGYRLIAHTHFIQTKRTSKSTTHQWCVWFR